MCLSKDDNIQIHQYVEMSQDLNPSSLHVHLWSFSCIGHTETTLSMQRQPRSGNSIPSFLQWTASIARSFWKVVPGTTFTSCSKNHLLWLERLTSKCVKLHTVAVSNNKDPTSSGVASPKTLGGKMFDFRGITLFYLEKRLSKHKMAIICKYLWEGHVPFPPGYAYDFWRHSLFLNV